MSVPQVFIGIDGSKAQLDGALRPTEACWHVTNAESGIASRVERLRTMQPALLGREATGGWAVPVTRGPGRGRSACRGGESPSCAGCCQRPRPLGQNGAPRGMGTGARGGGAAAATPPAKGAGTSVERFADATAPVGAEAHGRTSPLQRAPPRMRADIQAPIPWLTRRVARTDDDRAAAIAASPRWRAKDEILQRTPGVGPSLARTLVAEVPALRVLNRQEIAALRGVAPLTRDRGTGRGKRAVWGGRAHGRAVLDMRPLAAVRHHPVLKAFDGRLRAVGNAPKVALTACRRKLLAMLNAMLKHRTPWHEHYATLDN